MEEESGESERGQKFPYQENSENTKKTDSDEEQEISFEEEITVSEIDEEKRILQKDDFENIAGIRKDAYESEDSFTIKEERDRLGQLLEQADLSFDEDEQKPESLEDIAISSPSHSTTNIEEGVQNGFNTGYLEGEKYQNSEYITNGYKESRNYDEYVESPSERPSSNGPKSPSNPYTPKPIERFNEENKTGFAFGAKDQKEENKGKYKLR